jgi:hypothetical protein
MFEEMRDPRFARRLVRGADTVPDHMGDDRDAAVGDDHDFHAVRELEMRYLGPGRRARWKRITKQQCHGSRADGKEGATSIIHECSQ